MSLFTPLSLYLGVQQQQQGSQEAYEQYPQYEEQVQATHNLPLQVVKHTNSTGTQHRLKPLPYWNLDCDAP